MSDEAPGEIVAVSVDARACIGVGQCELLEPEVFEFDDDAGISGVADGATLSKERAQVAVDKCPARAISIVSQGG